MSAEPSIADSRRVDPTEWVDRYGDLLLNYALSRVPDRETAEDLVQEAFLAAWQLYERFDERSQLSTWLIAILRRKIADFYRSGKTPTVSFEEDDASSGVGEHFTRKGKWTSNPKKWSQSPADLIENLEFWQVVARCLQDMPAHLSYVFRLRELRSAKNDEIGKLLEITTNNVSVRLHRARVLIQQCLEDRWFGTKK